MASIIRRLGRYSSRIKRVRSFLAVAINYLTWDASTPKMDATSVKWDKTIE